MKLICSNPVRKILRFRHVDNRLWIQPVKVLLVLLVTAIGAQATPSDPGTVALDFLEKVRLRKLNLEPGGDTALSPQTADSKKRKIAKSLERMARDLGNDPLELGAVKLDDGFAAVLVRKVGGFDPNRLQVFPVALVKRDAEWTAAPMPASFENSGTGYAIELRKRLEQLENWMLRQQVVDLEQLREESAGRMRKKIEATLLAKDLRQMDSGECVKRFLAACDKGELPSILGFLGGLADDFPEDWAMRLKAAERAVSAGANAPHPWRLLTSPEVARVIVGQETDETSAFISIGCLDPAGSGSESARSRIELVHIELAKPKDGLWRINLPPPFFQTNPEPDNEEPEGDFDSELLNAFPAEWIKAHPLKPQASAEKAHQVLTEALGSGRFQSLLAISKIDSESGEDARKACLQAAEIGSRVLDPASLRHAMPLAFKSTDSQAVGLFQFFAARDPDRFEPRALYFEKSKSGWLWSPAPSSDTVKNLETWVATETRKWPDQWQQILLGDSPPLDEIDSLIAPSADDARSLVEKWLDATRQGDVKAALGLVARLDAPKSSSTLLQNLGYEITGSRRRAEKPTVTGIYQGKTWSAVGVRVDQGGKTTYPLYPILQTPQGPRILLEIDLFASGNRGREFLNRAALERLGKSTATAGELQKLFLEHQTHIESLGIKAMR